MKILFVEDNALFAEALLATVAKAKFSFTTVSSISDAKKAFDSDNYDIVITDIHLKPTPEDSHSSGMDLIHYIRQRKKSSVPIVVTTGLELIEEQDILESGADIFFHKEKLQQEEFLTIIDYLTSCRDIDHKAIFRCIPGLYLILSPTFNIIEVSESYLHATMTRRQEIMGRNIFKIFPDNPNDPQATGVQNLRASLNRVIEKLAPDTMAVQKYDIARPESEGGGFEERFWSPVNSPVLDGEGKLKYIIHRVEDVTTFVYSKRKQEEQTKIAEGLKQKVEQMEMDVYERAQELQKGNSKLRALNQELGKTTEQLKDVNQELEAFSYSVSHDLRSPLRAIHGFAQALKDEYSHSVDQEGKKYIDRIQAGTEKMGVLIDDLIRLAHFSKTAVQFVKLNMSSLAEEVFSEIRAHEPERKFKINIKENMIVMGDAGLIRALLWNLLGNAWKFSKMRDEACITFNFQETKGKKIYYIEDNGSGFEMKYAKNLFSPFQRFHSSKDFPGNGIGLATVRRIASRHGGKVCAESEVDKGTRVYFTLEAD